MSRDSSKINAADSPRFLDSRGFSCTRVTTRWVDRLHDNNKKLIQVQAALGSLSKQLDEYNKELAIVYINADLLITLRIAEYRQKIGSAMAPPPAKKMRSKRATTSRAANRLQPDSNCTEALIAAMDEKKRAKVSTMLGNFFKREIHDQGGSACYTPQPPAAQCLPSPAMQVLTTTAQAVEPRPTAPTNDSSKLFSSSGVNTRDLCSSFTDHNPNSQRRHRDVPPEIWEEMVKLRLKRLYLEEQIASLVTSIDAQTERFHCLMQIQAIGQYVTDGVLPSGGFVRKKKR